MTKTCESCRYLIETGDLITPYRCGCEPGQPFLKSQVVKDRNWDCENWGFGTPRYEPIRTPRSEPVNGGGE